MNTTAFADIFKKAAGITWKNRFLWWLGFFMFVGAGGSWGNFSYPEKSGNTAGDQGAAVLAEFVQNHLVLVGAIAIAVALIMIAFFVLGIMSRATVIKAVHNPQTYEHMKLRALIRAGAPYFWKLLLVEILSGIFMFLFVVLLAIPVGLLFYFQAWALGIIAALWAVAIFIPVVFMVYVIRQYAILFIVLAELAVSAGIAMAYKLLKTKLSESLAMTLWMILAGILFGSALVIVLLFAALIFVLIGLIMYALFAQVGVLITVGLGIAVLVVMILLGGSLYELFKQAAWVLLFKEISMKKIEAKSEELEKAVQPVTAPEVI